MNYKKVNIHIKQVLLDLFSQQWHEKLSISTKGKKYNSFKDDIALENYFKILPKNLSLNMVRFRTSNHKLSVEIGRWHNVEYDDRKCPLCAIDSLGDEYIRLV